MNIVLSNCLKKKIQILNVFTVDGLFGEMIISANLSKSSISNIPKFLGGQAPYKFSASFLRFQLSPQPFRKQCQIVVYDYPNW